VVAQEPPDQELAASLFERLDEVCSAVISASVIRIESVESHWEDHPIHLRELPSAPPSPVWLELEIQDPTPAATGRRFAIGAFVRGFTRGEGVELWVLAYLREDAAALELLVGESVVLRMVK
jgi:hypothetical protein